jgi:hypothetical protein
LCQKGNSRSVALAYIFKRRGIDALAAGLKTSSPETIEMLCAWADRIILTTKRYIALVPKAHYGKMLIWHVGTDIWFKGFDEDLINKFKEYMRKTKWKS